MDTSASGKIALVTGATSGIGLAASEGLAARGADVILVARDRERGQAAVEAVRRRTRSTRVSLMLCDFSRLRDVRALAADILATCPALHILVNNAGSVSATRELTEDGLERTLAVNHLGPFLLTNLLLDLLKRSAPVRVVIVSSVAHRRAELPFDNLQFEKGGYGIMRAYARSKLANVLFSAELSRRLAGTGVIVNCLHPGAVATNIWSHAPRYARPVLALAKLFMLSPEQGAEGVLHLAAGPEIEGQTGGYYDRTRKVRPSPLAEDRTIARELWERSAALVGIGV